MDKYRSQISLHKKYRQAKLSSASPSTTTCTASNWNDSSNCNGNDKYCNSNPNHASHNNEVSSFLTASTASASCDGSVENNLSRQSLSHRKSTRSSNSSSNSNVPFQPLGNTTQRNKTNSNNIDSTVKSYNSHLSSKKGNSSAKSNGRSNIPMNNHNYEYQSLSNSSSSSMNHGNTFRNTEQSQQQQEKQPIPLSQQAKGHQQNHHYSISNDKNQLSLFVDLDDNYNHGNNPQRMHLNNTIGKRNVDAKAENSPNRPSNNNQKEPEIITTINNNYYHNIIFIPTEAQLRWAQFHFKKRAKIVQKKIEQLMLFPLEEHDVDGAISGDGDSFSHDYNGNKTNTILLSRGRRALLRVSERKTIERRNNIRQFGFVMQPDEDDDNHNQSIMATETTTVTSNDNNNTVSSSSLLNGLDEINEALHVQNLHDDCSLSIFTDRIGTGESKSNGRDINIIGSTILSGKKKKKKQSARSTSLQRKGYANRAKHLKGKRSMVTTADEDEERMKRFEEAYLAMCSVSDNKNTCGEIVNGKRWTRGSHVPVAVSIDGRMYDDMQRSPAFKDVNSSRRYAAQMFGAELNGKQLTDRVASWMMHLPKNTTAIRDSLKQKGDHAELSHGSEKSISMAVNESSERQAYNQIVSPQKLKLMELVDRLQGQEFDKNSSIHTHKLKAVDHSSNERLEFQSPSCRDNNNQTTELEYSAVDVANIRSRLFQKSDGDNNTNFNFIKDKSSQHANVQLGDTSLTSLKGDIGNKLNEMATHVNTRLSVIDTDMQSDVSEGGCEHDIGTLLLSPTIITKRLKQAIHAIETCQWDHVSYLVCANPWLSEMQDIHDQFLLHKLAYNGAGNTNASERAPSKLNEVFINACPASIHTYDVDGNLPLHLAAAAGNADMVLRLGKLFPGGASVRNNKGHLPLHMSLLSCVGSDKIQPFEEVIKVILDMFPGGLAVADNDGNLPIHVASSYLSGSLGAQVIRLLHDKAVEIGNELRFPSGVRQMQDVDDNLSEADFDERETSILMVRNLKNWTPIMSAVKCKAGWQILDALFKCNGMEKIMFDIDNNGKNILQLTLEGECCDPPSTLSILKSLPKLVTKRDLNGALPIEIACIHDLQQEIIMAIALLDLPIDLDANNQFNTLGREDFGASWWYLNCECDDAHTNIVKEILEICDYQQKRSLCFAKNSKGRSIIRSATPKCKLELRKALRFVGRYEFVGNGASKCEDGSKIFKALDFGTDGEPIVDGQKVLLKYYESNISFSEEVSVVQELDFDGKMLVRMCFFHVIESESSTKSRNQYFIAIDDPEITLSNIVSNMDRKKYVNDHDRINRYISKLRKVFWMIGEGIDQLHMQGVVHGCIDSTSCGKFDDGWKLLNLIGSQRVGNLFHSHRFINSKCIPPEAIDIRDRQKSISIVSKIEADTAIDIFAYGKLMFEVFTGKQLIPVNSHKTVDEDENFLRALKNWNEDDLSFVVAEVEATGLGTLAADLISHCLCPFPDHRPRSMKEILSHPYWNEPITRLNGPKGESRDVQRRFKALKK